MDHTRQRDYPQGKDVGREGGKIMAEGFRISLEYEDLAGLHDQLADAVDELETFEATQLSDHECDPSTPIDERRFWHAHGNLLGLADTFAAWLDDVSLAFREELRSGADGRGQETSSKATPPR